MQPDPGFSISTWVIGFICVWMALVVAYALFKARSPQYDPLPPEMPEHHGDDHGAHGDHGHHAADDHAHAPESGHH